MLQFKTKELEAEWWTKKQVHPYLMGMHYAVAHFVELQFKGKNWIITQIGRDRETQITYYPDYYKKEGKPKPSLHCVEPVQAIDVRSKHLTEEEVQILQYFAFKYFVNKQLNPWGFKWHKKEGMHIHTQVKELGLNTFG